MVIEPCSSHVNISPSRAYLDIPWGRINQTISAHRLKDNHTRYIRHCSESSVDEYMVYPIDVSLDFNDTATELDGGCAPKSAVCRFHPDNDIDT